MNNIEFLLNNRILKSFCSELFTVCVGRFLKYSKKIAFNRNTFEPVHEISNNVVCATSNASDQPAHMRSLIRALASRLHIL